MNELVTQMEDELKANYEIQLQKEIDSLNITIQQDFHQQIKELELNEQQLINKMN